MTFRASAWASRGVVSALVCHAFLGRAQADVILSPPEDSRVHSAELSLRAEAELDRPFPWPLRALLWGMQAALPELESQRFTPLAWEGLAAAVYSLILPASTQPSQPRYPGTKLVLSQDGQRALLFGEQATALVLNLPGGAVQTSLVGHRATIFGACFLNDNSTVLTIGQDNTARLWDGRSGRSLGIRLTWEGNRRPPGSHGVAIACAKDGPLLAIAESPREVVIKNVATGAQLRRIVPAPATENRRADSIDRVMLSDSGRRLLLTDALSTVTIWDVDSGRLLGTNRLLADRAAIRPVPDGETYFTIDQRSVLRRHRLDGTVESGSRATSLSQSILISPHGRALINPGTDSIWPGFWDVDRERRSFMTLSASRGPVAMAFSSEQEWFTSSSEGLQRWSLREGRVYQYLEALPGRPCSMALSPDGRELLVAPSLGNVLVLDARTGRHLRALPGGAYWGDGCPMGWSSSGRRILAAGQNPSGARILDAESGQVIHSIGGDERYRIRAAALSPDGEFVAVVYQGRRVLPVWNPPAAQPIYELFDENRSTFNSVEFSSDGLRILTTSHEAGAQLWDAHNGRLLQTLWAHPNLVSAAFSPDGKRVATLGNNGSAGLFDPRSGRLVRMLLPPRTSIAGNPGRNLLVVSPDSRRIAVSEGEAKILVFDAADGRLLLALPRQEPVHVLQFSADGQELFTTQDSHPGVSLVRHPATHRALFAYACRALATVPSSDMQTTNEEPALLAMQRACRRLQLNGNPPMLRH